MTRLKELKLRLQLKGIIPQQRATIADVRWHSENAVDPFYRRADGQIGAQLLFRAHEANPELTKGRQQEQAGRLHRILNAKPVQRRADEMAARLDRRKEKLALEQQIFAAPRFCPA